MICLGMNRALMHIADIFFSPDMKYPFLNFPLSMIFFFSMLMGACIILIRYIILHCIGLYHVDLMKTTSIFWNVILGFLWYDISLLVNCAKIIFRIQMSLESDWLRIACYCLCINCFIKVKFFCKLTSQITIKLTKKFNFISKNNIYFLFAHSCCNDL